MSAICKVARDDRSCTPGGAIYRHPPRVRCTCRRTRGPPSAAEMMLIMRRTAALRRLAMRRFTLDMAASSTLGTSLIEAGLSETHDSTTERFHTVCQQILRLHLCMHPRAESRSCCVVHENATHRSVWHGEQRGRSLIGSAGTHVVPLSRVDGTARVAHCHRGPSRVVRRFLLNMCCVVLHTDSVRSAKECKPPSRHGEARHE